MGHFSWTHLILAVLIIIFASTGTTWLVIVLAAILAILSIFGVCSCGACKPKSIPKATPRKKAKRRKK